MKPAMWIAGVLFAALTGCGQETERAPAPEAPASATQTEGPTAEQAGTGPETAQLAEATFVEILPSDGPLKEQLAAEAANAAATGQRPFVYACSTILPPSVAIDSSLEHPLMKDAFAGTYIIRVDVHEWGAPDAEALIEGTGIAVNRCPVFYEIDAKGEATGRQIYGGAWKKDKPEEIAPALKEFFGDSGA